MQLANVTPPGPRVTSVTGRAANASANGTTARVSVNSATTASSTIPRVQVSVWRIHYLHYLLIPPGEFQGQFKRQLWMLLCGFGTNIQYLRQPYTSSNAFSLKTSMNSYTKSIVKSNCSFNFKNKRASRIAITQVSQFLNYSNVFLQLVTAIRRAPLMKFATRTTGNAFARRASEDHVVTVVNQVRAIVKWSIS